jgi:hypothetical protein
MIFCVLKQGSRRRVAEIYLDPGNILNMELEGYTDKLNEEMNKQEESRRITSHLA